MSSSMADPAAEHTQSQADRAASQPSADSGQPDDPEQLAEPASPDAPADSLANPPDEEYEDDFDGTDADVEDDSAPGQSPRFSKIAIAALLAGVLPLVPVAVGLGITGLVATRQGRRRGRELAVGGLVGAITWTGIGVAVAVVGVLTHGFHFHRLTTIEYSYKQPAVFSLREGDCIQDPNSSAPPVVSCSSPHAAEVFATLTLPRGPWPGTAAVQQDAKEDCSSRLAGYLNPQLTISLSQDYVYPGQVDWQWGTRSIVCEVSAATGQLTQSVRGTS